MHLFLRSIHLKLNKCNFSIKVLLKFNSYNIDSCFLKNIVRIIMRLFVGHWHFEVNVVRAFVDVTYHINRISLD